MKPILSVDSDGVIHSSTSGGTQAVVLLIGGPKDGEWIADKGAIKVDVPVASARPHSLYPILAPVLSRETYQRVEYGDLAQGAGLPIYVHQSLDINGALLRLLAHYKPSAAGRVDDPRTVTVACKSAVQ